MPTIFKRHEEKVKQAIEEQTGEVPAPAPAPAQNSGVRFDKGFTAEERKKHQAKLAEMLRKRGD